MPIIPGYLEPPAHRTLAELWTCPDGVAEALWPLATLRSITADPAEWVTVAEHYYSEERHGGTSCILVPAGAGSDALAGTDWLGRDLGQFGVGEAGDRYFFEDGLSGVDRGVDVQFFLQVRRPSGGKLPHVEVTYPFLWYWDAFSTRDGWAYLNRAGRDQDLIRVQLDEDSWKVEVRALELRQFLAAYERAAVIQLDVVPKAELEEFERVDSEFTNEWAHFDFHALHDPSMGARPAFSRLLGRYLLTGLRNSRVPRFEERRRDRHYLSFIYAIDSQTGLPLTHTCDPEQLGTYFDKDDSRLHYLTPIYFKREVLQPYAAEPGRYRVSASRLTCLDLWGLDISFNSAGLVEVYLGDLGRDLPDDEWGHWRTYNVPPQGKMDEGRFRRDFLAQFANSPDPVRDLRQARAAAAQISSELLGDPIWRPLSGDILHEFEGLVGPLTDDPVALGPSLLTLTKALVDGIDPAPLKSKLTSYDKGDQSLRLLARYVEQLGGPPEVTAIFRELQQFRSKGGIAHLAGSQRDKAAAELEITGMSNWEAFQSICGRLTAALAAISDLMSGVLDVARETPTTDGPPP